MVNLKLIKNLNKKKNEMEEFRIETLEKVTHEKIGLVCYVRSKRARRVRFTISSTNEIRVIIPVGMSLKYVKGLVSSKQEYILERIRQIREHDEQARKEYGNNEPIKVQESAQFLYDRLYELAGRHGFKYNKVSFRWQKTRWGSCSSKNNISLNLKIIRLPSKLQDYILLHELVHTIVKDHSKNFWEELDKYLPNSKQYRKELCKYKIQYL
ncbi:MAG: M48 family metallopeptidase [Candidatus Cloacimonetes bacterium]|nr:M48 family metallopeptidase [Candidatus Cloacimonadota bacterium]